MKLEGGPLEHTIQPTVLHNFLGSAGVIEALGLVEGDDEEGEDDDDEGGVAAGCPSLS